MIEISIIVAVVSYDKNQGNATQSMVSIYYYWD